MPVRTIRVAAVQLRAHDRENFARCVDDIAAAAERAAANADLIVLPEGTFPAYVLGDARVDLAAIEGALGRLGEIARRTRCVIVAGAAQRGAHGLRNAGLVFDADGSIAGSSDKIFLWHFDRRWFESGDRIAPIPTAVGKLGVLVCADGRIPTIARALVDRGAEILAMPTAWVTSGRTPQFLENLQADLLARVRARENGVPFVAANKCGVERAMVAYCGRSQIVSCTGETLALATHDAPQTVEATVTVGSGHPYRNAACRDVRAAPPATAPLRVAMSADPLPADIAQRLEWLDGDYAIGPDDELVGASAGKALSSARVDDAEVFDPAGLIPYRRAGYACAIWSARAHPQWVEPFARARAAELRLYVVALDRNAHRALAVDPDGAVIAGTFGDYRLASFSLDPRRTLESTVAPGTDIGDGFARVAAILQERPAPQA